MNLLHTLRDAGEIEDLGDLTDKANAIAAHMRPILEGLGMDLTDSSVKDTPVRFAKYLLEFHQQLDFEEIMGPGFDSDESAMVIQSGIPFRMMCEHHLLPATGRACVGYIPNKKVVGLSKLWRLVQAVGVSEPSLQEHICDTIAEALNDHIEPKGVMVVIEAEHDCMACRGVNSPGVITTTSSIKGVFLSEPSARTEFLSLAKVRSL